MSKNRYEAPIECKHQAFWCDSMRQAIDNILNAHGDFIMAPPEERMKAQKAFDRTIQAALKLVGEMGCAVEK